MVTQADSALPAPARTPAQPIAIVGMAGRFPGAPSVEDLRRNLLEGVESITFFDKAQLLAAELSEEDLADPDFVGAAPVLGGTDLFDAALFGLSAREAQLLDPQYRVFLEVCHEALQDGAVVPGGHDTRVGVYAGSKHNAYLDRNVLRNSAVMKATGNLMAIINNHTDYLATGVAYRLGLTGPAVTMVTACSTSLVAVHSAVQALRAGECEVALAGGVEIDVPEVGGYLYKEGGIFSPDGRVRPLDAKARGTVFGSGCGAVVLKRLDDAIADGNPIHAVIRGSSVNNDGNAKSGFFAPSRTGQVAVVNAALADAGVDPGTIGYVEAHGTGTLIGDPTEVGALSDAFRQHTDAVGYCAIASVKSNVGHLGAAAGITGLINAVCSVRDGLLAPVINFEEPNPRIDFGSNPFYVNLTPKVWAGDGPRRAAISSFGIGGTNANVIIEQAPTRAVRPPGRRPYQLLPMTANTADAVTALAADLADHLDANPATLADTAYTLSTGRAPLKFRTAVVAGDASRAAEALRAESRPVQATAGRTATFLFPGQGAQYPGMAAGLYAAEPVFRAEIDACATVLRDAGVDLHALLTDADEATLSQTRNAQPVLFAVEYALARTLIEAGVEPTAMAGHSVGEYVAATIAGVLHRDDALRLVARRGALMQAMAPGSMLAVTLPEEMLDSYLGDTLDVAAVNAPGMCVLSGPTEDIRQLADDLSVQGIGCQLLHTSHAFHSRMMDPMLAEFAAAVQAVTLRAPAIPFVSNTTGTWIGDDEATDPGYWVRHLRSAVRFSDTLTLLTTDGTRALIEVGPGRTLTGLVQAHDRAAVAVPTLSHPKHRRDDVETVLAAVGRVWSEGVDVDWARWWGTEQRDLLHLPAYPYQRQRYWIEPDPAPEPVAVTTSTSNDPFTTPVWLETAPLTALPQGGVWALVADPHEPVLGRLQVLAENNGVKVLTAGSAGALVDAVAGLGGAAGTVTVVHGLTLGARPAGVAEDEYADEWLARGFHSLLDVVQGLSRRLPGQAVDLVVVSSDMQDVAGDGRLEPAKAALLGVVKVAPKEVESLTCRSIDVAGDADPARTAAQLLAEIAGGTDSQVAYRGRKRWTWSFTGLPVDAPDGVPATLRDRGVYLLTGGLGGLGLELCRQLAEAVAARLVILTLRPMPDRELWQSVLDNEPDSLVAGRVRGILAAEAAGAEVLVLQADVTDEAQLRAAAAQVHERFGPVDGVFHLAAVPSGAMMETRQHADAARVLAPKVAGTYLLEAVFDPELMVLYSSIAVFSAEFGLGDYVGANAVLDAYAQSRNARGRQVLSINWPPFDDVGMAAVIVAPSVIGNLLFDSSGSAAAQTEDEPAELTPVAHPMLAGRERRDDDTVRYAVDLSPNLWVLAEHKLGGAPTMPGTGIVELIRAAHQEQTGQQYATVRNLVFQRPLRVLPGMRAWLELGPHPDGGYEVTLSSGGDVYARGRVTTGPTAPAQTVDAAAARDGFVEVSLPELESLVPSLAFGPRWESCIRRRWSGPGCEVLEVELGEQFLADLREYTVHPAALDCAVGIGQILAGDGGYLPFSYDEVAVHAPMPARFHSVIRHRDDTTGDLTTADIQLVADDGTVVVDVRGFAAIRFDNGFTEQSVTVTVDTPVPTGTLVTADQGAEALRQLLGAKVGPQAIWCPEGLANRIRRSERVTRSAIAEQVTAQTGGVGGAGAERTLSTEYVAPEGDLELALADLWSQTLGVEQIGAGDDFFDLGGNSLFAVQLVSRISQRFSVEASAALLFDSRNIGALAAAIEDLLLAKVANLSEEEAQAALNAHGAVAHAAG